MPSTTDVVQAKRGIAEWLEKYRQLRVGDSSWAYRSFADLVAEHGVFYSPASWPLSDEQQPGRCFKAARECSERTAWTYAEGFVLAPSAAPFIVFEHAWCLTGDGRVADPSLPDGMAEGYLGIPLSGKFCREQRGLRATDAVFASDPSNPLTGINDYILRVGLPQHAVTDTAAVVLDHGWS
ncbi:hypothetical protein [Streptomyces noursei]|uniref:hypothetical protein n=1 Tax=Streptomyces noursei TaxID=1971 RepID=UPI0011AF74B9|nr:hypothetical protein [Streptomyces noursei]